VQALLDESIIARSSELKERALRRRCAKVVAGLSVAVARAAEAEDEARAGAEKTRRELAACAARLDADASAVAEKLAASLPHDALARDLALVVTGRSDGADSDDVLRRYRVDRAVFHFAGPLAAALARETPGLGATTWRTIARASVRAAALAGADDVAPAAARAALTSVIEDLVARSVAPAPPQAARGLAAELESLAELLRDSSRTPSSPR